MASQRVTSRRGMVGERGLPPSIGVFITMVVAIIFFGILTIVSGKVDSLIQINQLTLVSLGIAGIIHFVIGRTCSYNAFKHIGVNAASPFISMNSFYAIIFGFLFLGERLSMLSALSAGLILSGVLVITIFKPRLSKKGPVESKNFLKGVLFALGAGLSFGSSAPLIRLGLLSGGSPIVGPFISYLFSLSVYFPIILISGKMNDLKQIRLENSKFFLLSGVLVNTAHMARYAAFALAPISIAAPILSSNEMFSILFTSLLIKKYELFNRPIIVGILLSVIGVILAAFTSIR